MDEVTQQNAALVEEAAAAARAMQEQADELERQIRYFRLQGETRVVTRPAVPARQAAPAMPKPQLAAASAGWTEF